jgi:predicted negative regulator of RcsB-dependent stress response
MTPIDELRHLLNLRLRRIPWTQHQADRAALLVRKIHADGLVETWQGMGGDKSAMVNPKDGDTW